MTTPNQPAPSSAFVIGGNKATGDSGYNFGQNYTEGVVRALFEVPALGIETALELLKDILLKMPLEALKMFGPLIPDWIEEDITDVLTAVEMIMDALIDTVTFLRADIFQGFLDAIAGGPGATIEFAVDTLKDGLEKLESLVATLLAMFGVDIEGTLLDQIFDLVDEFDSWFGDFDGLLGNFDDLLGNFNILNGDFGSLLDIFGGGDGLDGVGNFLSNLLSVFGIVNILDLTGDTGSFDPASIIQNFIQNILNPTGFLEALLPENIMENLQGLLGGIDLDSILDFDDVWSDLITGVLNPLELFEDADAREFFQDLVDTLLSVVRGIPVVGGSIAEALSELTDWFDDTQTTAGQASDALLGLDDLFDSISNALTGGLNPGGDAAGIFNGLKNLLSLFSNPTGLTGDPGSFNPIAAGVEIISDFVPDLVSGFANIFDNWFGGTSAAGTPAEVATTIAAIRATVTGGFTLQTFTSSNSSWTVPPELANASEAYAFAIGGGNKGQVGSNTVVSNGGGDGGFTSETIDASALGATLNITVGAGASSNGGTGGATQIVDTDNAVTLVKSITGVGAIGTPQGYIATNSTPGVGGQGGMGDASPVNGTSGTSSAVAAGGGGGLGKTGAFGAAVTGGTGTAGGAGNYTKIPLCGGGGGGGGGGADGTTAPSTTGGTGGAGGFPGGGSGGGGGASPSANVTHGNGGTPGNGLAALLWR